MSEGRLGLAPRLIRSARSPGPRQRPACARRRSPERPRRAVSEGARHARAGHAPIRRGSRRVDGRGYGPTSRLGGGGSRRAAHAGSLGRAFDLRMGSRPARRMCRGRSPAPMLVELAQDLVERRDGWRGARSARRQDGGRGQPGAHGFGEERIWDRRCVRGPRRDPLGDNPVAVGDQHGLALRGESDVSLSLFLSTLMPVRGAALPWGGGLQPAADRARLRPADDRVRSLA